jgi:hypothetical protein
MAVSGAYLDCSLSFQEGAPCFPCSAPHAASKASDATSGAAYDRLFIRAHRCNLFDASQSLLNRPTRQTAGEFPLIL